MVYRRKWKIRSLFRKLPVTANHWVASIPAATYVKIGRRSIAGASDTSGVARIPVPDISVGVIRVPDACTRMLS